MGSIIIFDTDNKIEYKYLSELLEEKSWFDNENFPIYWPKNLDSLKDEIQSVNNKVLNYNKWLSKEWLKIDKEYFKEIKKLNHGKIFNHYKCHISYFGVEGRYTAPNKLFVRIRNAKDKSRVLETIGHELLHLVFDSYFYSKRFTYREREWLVDHIILGSEIYKLFPKYIAQSIGKPKPGILRNIIYAHKK